MAALPPSMTEMFTSITNMIEALTIIVHFIFAAAIAKDAGELVNSGRKTYLVSGIVWAFATLVGGVFIAAVYWIIHYSTLVATIPNKKD